MRPDDPADHSDEIVGSWPSIDFARLGLPPLGWLFVVAAVFVAVQHLRWMDGGSLEAVPDEVFSTVAAVTIVLLPAALLWRVRAATRTHRLLLAGLAAGAVSELLRAVVSFAPFVSYGALFGGTVIGGVWPLFGPLGGLLAGLGLVRLRPAGVTRIRLLAAIATAYVALDVGSFAIAFAGSHPPGSIDPHSAVLLVIRPLAAAFAVWVPVAAWFDDEAPRAFWGLLALALPLNLLSRLTELPEAIVIVALRSNALFLPAVTIGAIVGAFVALLALVAFARETPVQPGTRATTSRISAP